MEMFFLRTVAPLAGIASVLVVMLLVVPLVLYVVARWRAHHSGVHDDQLGLKFALHYFAVSAFQLGLAGGALFIYMLISPSTGDAAKGAGYRAAVAFIIPAGVVLAAHVALLKRTNDEVLPGVRRLFWGYNMVITGLVAFFALVLGFQALFAKGPTGGVGHTAGSMIVVYGSAWAVVGYKFGQLVLGSGASTGGGGGMAEPVPYPPPPHAAPPVQQTQTGLPVLGGGSYPPLDPPK